MRRPWHAMAGPALMTAVLAHAVGFQVSAATLGFAVLPGAAGRVAERHGLEAIGPLLAGFALALLLHEALAALDRRPRPEGVGDTRQ